MTVMNFQKQTKKGYVIKKENVIKLVQPGEFKDQLTEILRQGAQALVMQAVEAECAAFLEEHAPRRSCKMAIGEVCVTCTCQRERWSLELAR